MIRTFVPFWSHVCWRSDVFMQNRQHLKVRVLFRFVVRVKVGD
jgi:hypothetical protein